MAEAQSVYVSVFLLSLCFMSAAVAAIIIIITYQVTYLVRPHLFQRRFRTSESRGLVLEVAHPHFLHMLEAVLERIHSSQVNDPPVPAIDLLSLLLA